MGGGGGGNAPMYPREWQGPAMLDISTLMVASTVHVVSLCSNS